MMTTAIQTLIKGGFKQAPDGALIPPPDKTTDLLAIKSLLDSGYSLDDQGAIQPPWLTITEVQSTLTEPMPSRATIKREAASGSFLATKSGLAGRGHWLIHQPSFSEWLSEWRSEWHRHEEIIRQTDALSLGGRFSPEDCIFPDPEGLQLIIINESLRGNEFVNEFLSYHGEKLPPVIYWEPVEFWEPLPEDIEIKTSRHPILWIGDEMLKHTHRWRCWQPPSQLKGEQDGHSM